ncbi:hypothetical protein KC909_00330 [Candidatus Dojkabacteria bacterium]|uniref:Uncharacterized protein n=1 Tax=Candidatus Dojkabacteria bacterium TaxID=2099670 RepID=A0A955L4G1_9BACT|nr:hypothetical protein [Candidatus Dojkabacteria bacterium]
MSEANIYAVSPRMENSAGHDKLMALMLGAFEDMHLEPGLVTLKPQVGESRWNITERRGWASVERAKAAISSAHLEGQTRATWMNAVGDFLRDNGLFNDRLLETYTRKLRLLPEQSTLVTSHYMAGAFHTFPDSWNFVMIPPDNKPQEAVARLTGKANTTFWAVNSHVKDELSQLGTPEELIVNTGLLLPNRIYDAINDRLAIQFGIENGNTNLGDHFFVSIGASAPEMPQAIWAVDHLLRAGIRTTVHCGDGRDISIEFRQRVEAIFQSINSEYEIDDLLTITGGEKGVTRDDELQNWLEHLADPTITKVVTRPNEMLNIAPALGMGVILLAPFQFHEQHSYDLITRHTQRSNVIPISDPIQVPTGISDNFSSGFWLLPTSVDQIKANPRAMNSLGLP